MEIKYSGYNPTQTFCVPKYNFNRTLKRDEWTDVPEEVARILLKNYRFICKDDVLFDTTNFKNLNKTIGLVRHCALGDIIQLIPIVHYLKRTTNNKYYLVTQPYLVEQIKSLNVFDDVVIGKTPEIYKMINLDGVLEKDHDLNSKAKHMHRIHIYEEFLNIKLDKYDFSVYI